MPKRKRTRDNTATVTSTADAKKPSGSRSRSSESVIPITQNPRPPEPAVVLPPAVVTDVDLASDRSSEPLAFGPTPLAVAFRYVDPTWRNYIMYVDLEARTGNKDAMRYLTVWKSLPPSERRSASPEQLCELSSVQPSDLISWVSRQVWQEGSAEASMVMSFQRHKVLAKTAQFATESPDNYKHAELFMKAAGMMPQPGRGGSPVTIFNTPTANANATSVAKSDASVSSKTGLLDMDDEIVSMAKIMQADFNDAQLHRKDLDEGPEDKDDDEEDEDDDDDESED